MKERRPLATLARAHRRPSRVKHQPEPPKPTSWAGVNTARIAPGDYYGESDQRSGSGGTHLVQCKSHILSIYYKDEGCVLSLKEVNNKQNVLVQSGEVEARPYEI